MVWSATGKDGRPHMKFYDLWIALLDFVNQKYTLIEELYGMTSPMGLPLKSVGLISSKLWEDKEIIDEFVLSGFKKLTFHIISFSQIYSKFP